MKKKNNRGFTLAEIVVSLAILALIVFTFTPLILSSFQALMKGRELRDGMLSQKSTVETEIADNISELGEDNVRVRFTQGGTTRVITVEGTFLQASGGVNPLTTFVANDEGQFSISPSVIAHGHTVTIKLYSPLVTFDDVKNFSFTYGNNQLLKDNLPKFEIDATDSHYAVMKITSNKTANFKHSPYKIRYFDGVNDMGAFLTVKPPVLAAAGDGNKWYYKADTESKSALDPTSPWITSEDEDPLPTSNILDMVWSGSQFVASGNGKSVSYTGVGDDAKTSGWRSVDTKFKSDSQIYDLDVGTDGNIYYAGYDRVDWGLFYVYYPGFGSVRNPTEFSSKETSGDTGLVGRAIVGNGSSTLYGWMYDGNARFKFGEFGSYDKNKGFTLGKTEMKGVDWNDSDGRMDSELPSEYIAVGESSEILSYFPSTGKDRDDAKVSLTEEEYVGTEPGSESMVLPIVVKGNGNGNQEDTVTFKGTLDELVNSLDYVPAVGQDGKIKYKPATGGNKYIEESGDLIIEFTRTAKDTFKTEEINMSGDTKSIVYGNETWVISGKDLKRNATVLSKTYVVTETIKMQLYPPEGNGSGSFSGYEILSRTTKKEKPVNETITNNSPARPIIYRPAKVSNACEWQVATLKKANGSLSPVTDINRVTYVGGRYYAGGYKCIYSSSDGINWVEENGSFADDIRAIAGSGS